MLVPRPTYECMYLELKQKKKKVRTWRLESWVDASIPAKAVCCKIDPAVHSRNWFNKFCGNV